MGPPLRRSTRTSADESQAIAIVLTPVTTLDQFTSGGDSLSILMVTALSVLTLVYFEKTLSTYAPIDGE